MYLSVADSFHAVTARVRANRATAWRQHHHAAHTQEEISDEQNTFFHRGLLVVFYV